jgi:predicted dehydrogenase
MSQRQTRRSFLKHTAISAAALGAARSAGAAAAAANPSPSAPARRGANDRIRLGIIGCGGLGFGHHIPKLMELSADPKVNVELAAVCDIYEPRKQRAKEKTGAELFHDYRKMLDRRDIDGVVIVTPDHWHAKMAIEAMQAGKDVHVEKPMTLHWEEAKQVYQTSERLGRVVQVGAEGTSRDMFWQARKLIADGAIGKLVWVSGGVYRNDPGGDWNWPMDPDCSPANLDWDAFLGPAPKRPFEPERYFRYRKFWDYSGGVAHDLIAHVLAGVQICIGAEFPTRVSGAGGIYVHHDRETPDTFSMQVEYPGKYLCTFACTQTTEQGDRMIIRGNKATIRFSPHQENPAKVFVTPEKAYAHELKELTLAEQPRIDHDRNFIECMRTRSKPHYDALTGYKAMVALDLANRSWREGKMFKFDPQKQEIVA